MLNIRLSSGRLGEPIEKGHMRGESRGLKNAGPSGFVTPPDPAKGHDAIDGIVEGRLFLQKRHRRVAPFIGRKLIHRVGDGRDGFGVERQIDRQVVVAREIRRGAFV